MRSQVMNTGVSVRHLEQIFDKASDVPILLLWDRAPWHLGQPIGDVLSCNPRLEVTYFSVTSLDLNP
jgi:hypothetical protein